MVCAVICIAVPFFLVSILHQAARERDISVAMVQLKTDLSNQVALVLEDAKSVLDTYSNTALAPCNTVSQELMRQVSYTSVYVKDLMVSDGSNNIICSVSEKRQTIRSRTAPQNLPDSAYQIEAVQVESGQLEALLVSRNIAENRKLSALVLSNALLSARKYSALLDDGYVMLSMEDGTDVGRWPNSTLSLPASDRLEHYRILESELTGLPFRMTVLVANTGLEALPVNHSVPVLIFGALMFGTAVFIGLWFLTQADGSAIGNVETAIKDGQLVASYQPIIDLRTGRYIGCEALVRLRRPDGTLAHPNTFIEEAEGSGLAVEMTVLLMQRVREDLEAFYSRHPSLKVSINLFSDHLNRPETIAEIKSVFAASNFRFEQLTFELTERLPMESSHKAKEIIAGLQALGCQVALDDVGTGHNGLKYLMELGVDIIKIDKLFIDGVSDSGFSKTIVEALIKLAGDMQILVVAEGIESVEQVAKLKELGVDMAQGYFYSRPLGPQAYKVFMEEAISRESTAGPKLDPDDRAPKFLKLVNANQHSNP